jgi:hypothetical protein
MAEQRLFCDMSRLTAANRVRLHEIARQIAAARPAVAELTDGYALTFGGDRATYQLVAEWLGYERLCCGFLEITITSTADAGPIVVALTGADGAKEVLREEFAGMLGQNT